LTPVDSTANQRANDELETALEKTFDVMGDTACEAFLNSVHKLYGIDFDGDVRVKVEEVESAMEALFGTAAEYLKKTFRLYLAHDS
jgi:hypothetical protein